MKFNNTKQVYHPVTLILAMLIVVAIYSDENRHYIFMAAIFGVLLIVSFILDIGVYIYEKFTK